MLDHSAVLDALRQFADDVRTQLGPVVSGEPEEQLRTPFANFMERIGRAGGDKLVCVGETKLPERLGKPDFAVTAKHLLLGYVELKAPGYGADTKAFRGRNKAQWERFKAIPNLLYSDGNQWALYRSGKREGPPVTLSGDITEQGKKAVTAEDAKKLAGLLRTYLDWKPAIPHTVGGKVKLKAFAELLAPLCRMLREDVMEALAAKNSSIVQLAKDWRQLLFPGASDAQFADAYAQTVTFALLLGRTEGANPLTLESAEAALAAQHNLLSRALQVLTDSKARNEMSASLDLLLCVVAAVPPAAFAGAKDPWLYFYEDFLASYDPKLRKDAGAYYTPVEVVRAQVRLIDNLLVGRLGKPLGFASPGVVTLDPAAGTGTYLLGVIEHALSRVESEQGEGAVPGQATELAKNLYGFERMVGPYSVTELRVSRALRDRGGILPDEGTHIYLTDTLESPHAVAPDLPLYLKPISDQHEKALNVKNKVPVIVCLGNPPYDRHKAATRENMSATGGWVRWGDTGAMDRVIKGKEQEDQLAYALMNSFIQPVKDAGFGGHLKNLYNLYVYFWRWALWKVFESDVSPGPGVVSYISASSYLEGDAFCGMREHMRRQCDEIWILDLGGEGRGTRKTDNVFAIQTPVAIAVAFRGGKAKPKTPAVVHYAMIEGTEKQKLKKLDGIEDFGSLTWEICQDGWRSPFKPKFAAAYNRWPLLTDVFPWQHSGVQLKRTWPLGPCPSILKKRWQALLHADDLAFFFKETRDRKVDRSYPGLFKWQGELPPLCQLPCDTAIPPVKRYDYRSFDRQWVLADNRLGDYFRPDLWACHNDRQVYLVGLFSTPLGSGPALTACSGVPDMDFFRGSYGAKAVIPLFADPHASQPNLAPGVLDILKSQYGKPMLPEDCAAYAYGILAHPAFTHRFAEELGTRDVRMPITKNPTLFEKVRAIGARLIWLHTYGERFVPKGKHKGHIPQGKAKCVKAVPGDADGYPEGFDYDPATQTLHVGQGRFAPVPQEVYEFEVSGLKVVQSWLAYRMKEPKCRKPTPLDKINVTEWPSEFTTELLDLLWVLEHTVEGYPEQAALLEKVVEGDCFTADELPEVPDKLRKPPKAENKDQLDMKLE